MCVCVVCVYVCVYVYVYVYIQLDTHTKQTKEEHIDQNKCIIFSFFRHNYLNNL